MSDVAIRAENLGKRYLIGSQKEQYGMLRDFVVGAAKAPLRRLRGGGQATAEEFWALRDVSFDLKQGEILGVIGKNGAGKSTLLKILSRITEPTSGRATIHGRVGSLLEVGTGFHPELTGRENIFLNGAIIGMTKRDIAKRFDEIAEFAGVEQFLDTPVKRYSSGMYTRLAFSVAAHLEPEVLIVDEVLSVGDAAFQRKSLGKMGEVAREGRTVLFVSHNLAAVRRLCRTCLLLRNGNVQCYGVTDDVMEMYLSEGRADVTFQFRRPEGAENARVMLSDATVVNSRGEPTDKLLFGEPFGVQMTWNHQGNVPGAAYSVRIHDRHDRLITAFNTVDDPLEIEVLGERKVECRTERNVLPPGTYRISLGCFVRPHSTIEDHERCLSVTVTEMPYDRQFQYNIAGDPLMALPGNWRVV